VPNVLVIHEKPGSNCLATLFRGRSRRAHQDIGTDPIVIHWAVWRGACGGRVDRHVAPGSVIVFPVPLFQIAHSRFRIWDPRPKRRPRHAIFVSENVTPTPWFHPGPKENPLRYPSPKNLLYALATRGTSTTRNEALRLLELDLPEKLPRCERRTRQSLLRRLACDKKRGSGTRLKALKELLFGLAMSEQEALAELKKGTSK
jgi:hypothetical protein